MDKEDMGGRGGVARPQDGDDVGDAQQRDDHQQGSGENSWSR